MVMQFNSDEELLAFVEDQYGIYINSQPKHQFKNDKELIEFVESHIRINVDTHINQLSNETVINSTVLFNPTDDTNGWNVVDCEQTTIGDE